MREEECKREGGRMRDRVRGGRMREEERERGRMRERGRVRERGRKGERDGGRGEIGRGEGRREREKEMLRRAASSLWLYAILRK